MRSLRHFLFAFLFATFALSSIAASPISQEEIEQAFSKKSKMLDALVQLLQPIASMIEKDHKAFDLCDKNAHANDWTRWRETKLKCGSSQSTPDDFRRYAIEKIEEAVTKILIDSNMVPTVKAQDERVTNLTSASLRWIAIGTLGATSDIDTVGVLDDESYMSSQMDPIVPKVVAEVRAKSLFDALGIAVFGQPLGVVFDTESYIDVTDDLQKAGYEQRIQSPTYQNLGFTLAFAQLARQLHHPISVGRASVYDSNDFSKQFASSNFMPLLEDASRFSDLTYPESDPKENIRKYLPIINYLATVINASSDVIYKAKLKGILGTYFPEAYYTREALAHVCYSDDEFSQLMMTLIAEYWKQRDAGEIPPEKINEFKSKTITPNDFVFAVSALENLGYFFHRLDGEPTPYDALKNAAKYFFRITRALAGYWHVGSLEHEASAKDNEQQKYARTLYHVAAKLERLKRGILPFASPEDAEDIIKRLDAFSKRDSSEQQRQTWAGELYQLHANRYISPSKKVAALVSMAKRFDDAVVYENQKFVLTKAAANNEGAMEFVALLDLIGGTNSNPENTKLQKEKKEAQIKQLTLPQWTEKEAMVQLDRMQAQELRAFLSDFTSFVKQTLEDFAKRKRLPLQSIELTREASLLIKAATN